MKTLLKAFAILILANIVTAKDCFADYARGMEYFRKAYQSYQSRDLKNALELIRSSLKEDPENPQSFALEGDIYYNLQDLGPALQSWQKALELNPRLETIRQKVIRLKAEKEIEEKLAGLKNSVFELRVESGMLGEGLRKKIMLWLEEAYETIGRDFNYFPKHKIIVLLYSPRDFNKIRALPEWVAGLYDGKIRIPLRESTSGETELQRIIRHEYTHSVIFDLSAGKCPVFLNEGLAEYESQPKTHDKQPYPLITYFLPENLNNTRLELDAGKFYRDAESLTAYILTIWGWDKMRNVLSAIKRGKEWPRSMQDNLNISPQELEKRWIQWLKN